MNFEENDAIKSLISSDDARVSYSPQGTLTVGKIGDLSPRHEVNLNYYDWSYWYPSYPTYHTTIFKTESSAFEKAFKIVSKLMEKGHVKELTVKEFTQLVEEVADELRGL